MTTQENYEETTSDEDHADKKDEARRLHPEGLLQKYIREKEMAKRLSYDERDEKNNSRVG